MKFVNIYLIGYVIVVIAAAIGLGKAGILQHMQDRKSVV